MHLNLKKILFLLAFVLISCRSTKSIHESSETVAYESIKKDYKNKNWEALEKEFGEFRTRYPYSKYTPELELLQADGFFQAKNYPSAAVTYEDFIRRNPNHVQRDLATFRIAESYDRDSSREIDRDQSNTEKALEKYKEFVNSFPESNLVKQAHSRIKVLTNRIADHYFFIANFYWNQSLFAAALSRYLYIIEHFPEFEDMVKTSKKNAIVCYRKLASRLEDHPKDDKYVYFRDETPESLREKGKALENSLAAESKKEKKS